MALPSPLPDDPRKWDGWSRYNSADFYERLCLDFETKPTDEEIEENSRLLLVWWQKKLPLKNQPSNPLAQLLRSGIDHAPRHIAEARVDLLNAERRTQIDSVLFKRRRETALIEFRKFLDFALANKVLTPDSEASLEKVGLSLGLSPTDLTTVIEMGLRQLGATRAADVPEPEPVAPPPEPEPAAAVAVRAEPEPDVAAPAPLAVAPAPVNQMEPPRTRRVRGNNPAEEFRRMLRLSGLDEDSMSDDRRDTFIDMAENLGLDPGEAEDMVDDYLEAITNGQTVAKRPASTQTIPASVPVSPLRTNGPATIVRASPVVRPAPGGGLPRTTPQVAAAAVAAPILPPDEERRLNPDFVNGTGMQMVFIPSATFQMGNSSPSAPANEQPAGRVSLSRYFISRLPVTNADFEKFSAAHLSRRGSWADETHPAVYVSALDAAKFCQWLSVRDRRRYRLPTEAEWEYAAKGQNERSYPWGEQTGRGDLANFADANTTFAWRDETIDDGFAETAPVGAYRRGASPFGIEDMAGNVWEWCADFYAEYKAGERINPRGPQNGSQRVYRGGSWKSRFANLRTTARGFNLPTYASNDVGFRIVCECE